MYGDFSDIFDDISRAAKAFQQELSGYARNRHRFGGENANSTGSYDQYCWPPVNVYTDDDDTLVFEFGLAGFHEEDVGLTFQGDYMVLSALCRTALKNCDDREQAHPEIRYLKKALRFDPVEKQKYYVPADKYAQEKTKAVFKNGLLTVNIPVKETDWQNGGIKIEISS
ncbi:MAG: Hsp20/alpha crystallin family protein [Spirochaetaceae bacterium]|jgi:HSP20 family molecular chaperone IbpA|nr:Hsp20/alpha crystallin family protein [Spirochaetaceae bacterium]